MEHRAAAEDIIDFLEMEAIRDAVVGELGYGLRKRVDLGRAMAMDPKILVMDEPMAGMNVEEKEDMARFILDIQEYRKIPVILVEHDMEVVMDISDRRGRFGVGPHHCRGATRRNPGESSRHQGLPW